jgi:hypothetical protein
MLSWATLVCWNCCVRERRRLRLDLTARRDVRGVRATGSVGEVHRKEGREGGRERGREGGREGGSEKGSV